MRNKDRYNFTKYLVFIIVSVFSLIYFGLGIIKQSDPDNIVIKGTVINYEEYLAQDNTTMKSQSMYKEIIEYEYSGQKLVYKSNNGSAIKPVIGQKTKLVYIKKTGEIITKRDNNTIFLLMLMGILIIMMLEVKRYMINSKKNDISGNKD